MLARRAGLSAAHGRQMHSKADMYKRWEARGRCLAIKQDLGTREQGAGVLQA